MLSHLQEKFDTLEKKRRTLLQEIEACTDAELCFQPGPDRWSITMVIEHMVMGERGIRLKGAEVFGETIEADPKADDLFKVVIDILDKDVPVDVPDPAIEPAGDQKLPALLRLWDSERQALAVVLDTISPEDTHRAIASHPVTGPLEPSRTLELAIAHFDTHHRQILRILEDIRSSGELTP